MACLAGEAVWMGRTCLLRSKRTAPLSSSLRRCLETEKVLDRETEGAFLIAELVCYEQDALQSVYRIVVEILNENDNIPIFVDGPVQSAIISELTPVNAIVFKVQATDADNDVIMYTIDQESPDAKYFKVVLPNSGEVVLAKPLDYETKTLLTLVVHASEMSTAEQHSRSALVSITVQDGDDQYPHFLPCTVLSHVCVNPTYTANVTQGQQDLVLSFSPGPIHAVDGDRGLSSSISYDILSGNDEGHFQINRYSGEMSLTQGSSDRLSSPVRHLQVMAFQDDDPRKYSVVAVVVYVVARNQFPPVFEKSQYPGFVTVGPGTAALVHTYGDRELVLTVTDQDFNQSVNPMIVLSLSPSTTHTSAYSVTKEGLLIANTGQLVPGQRHGIQVRAVDQESGESIFTTVTVEVLAEGQAVPYSERSSNRLSGCVVGKAFFVCLLALALGLCGFYLCLWIRRRLQEHEEPLERGSVAQAKHPNVSLRCFQLVSHGSTMPLTEDRPFSTDDCGTSNPSFSDFDQDGLSHHEAPNSYDLAHTCDQASSQDTEKMSENMSLETLPCDSPLCAAEACPTPTPSPPSSPSSPAQLHSRRLVEAHIDKPLYKVVTPPTRSYSHPLNPRSPAPSPELLPVRAHLVHIHSVKEATEGEGDDRREVEPCTSLDNSDNSSHGAPSHGLKENMEAFRDTASPELLSDEEELLNVLERCYPVMITFRK
uniref:Cadherin domain-containing protein n=1 Tax=Knipowitschia caucasica TaxID=637954 RepID=A0AAV2KVZ0_KNICA